MSRPLAQAAALVEEAFEAAEGRGDTRRAQRLRELLDLVSAEAQVEELVGDGPEPEPLSIPPGASVGWLMRHEPHVRQLRRIRGLEVPDA